MLDMKVKVKLTGMLGSNISSYAVKYRRKWKDPSTILLEVVGLLSFSACLSLSFSCIIFLSFGQFTTRKVLFVTRSNNCSVKNCISSHGRDVNLRVPSLNVVHTVRGGARGGLGGYSPPIGAC